MVNDPIADLLTRIRNAQLRGKDEVRMPRTRVIEEIARILSEEGYLESYTVEESEGPQSTLVLMLKYGKDGEPAIRNLKRVSKPGLRIYTGYKDIKPVLNNLGIGILSTPKGILTTNQAMTEKVGGEYLCNIW